MGGGGERTLVHPYCLCGYVHGVCVRARVVVVVAGGYGRLRASVVDWCPCLCAEAKKGQQKRSKLRRRPRKSTYPYSLPVQ